MLSKKEILIYLTILVTSFLVMFWCLRTPLAPLDVGPTKPDSPAVSLPAEHYTVFFVYGIALHTDSVSFTIGADTLTVNGGEYEWDDIMLIRDNWVQQP